MRERGEEKEREEGREREKEEGEKRTSWQVKEDRVEGREGKEGRTEG